MENTPTQVAPQAQDAPKVNERQFEIVRPDGQKQTITESQLIERYRKAEGLESRVQQAAKLEQAMNNLVAQIQDPSQLMKLLENPALKYDEEKQEALAKSLMSTKNPKIIGAVKKWIYDNELEDPEKREVRELREFKEAQEKRNRELEEQERTRREQEQTEQYWAQFRAKVGEELTTQGLPQKEAIVGRVARYAMLYRRAGRDIDFKDCVLRVKNDLINEYKQIHSDSNEDNILDRVPPELAEMINKALIKRLKAKDKEKEVQIKKDFKPQNRTDSDAEKRKKAREWMRALERGQKI